jgi:uncharacterized membrane protein
MLWAIRIFIGIGLIFLGILIYRQYNNIYKRRVELINDLDELEELLKCDQIEDQINKKQEKLIRHAKKRFEKYGQ